ncbi:probable methyltransferase-like protein 25 [Eurosta solidaginis]|uniref:probable methyltransferase-like protein 25 n=1 Tax=Eurosta solidaginis TaxID=178769 RepID=UPI00353064E3
MSINHLRVCLEDILHFMQPHWEFVNCHMVSYLTERHWKRYVPVELQNEVPDVDSAQKCIEEVFWKSTLNEEGSGKFAEFKRLLDQCESLHLDKLNGVLTPMSSLSTELVLIDDVKQNLTINEFMSAKKRHEVELTATLVDRLIHRVQAQNCNADVFIVDAGDGKGYLSSRLALQYGHQVLGVDFQASNTENAMERNRKLQRAWNGLVNRAELHQQGLTPKRRKKKLEANIKAPLLSPRKSNERQEALYKTADAFITPDMNLAHLLQKQFTKASEKSLICLTGLHTCGNLGPTCLKLFHEQPQCRLLCNIGCCYHLLQEAFAQPEYLENETIPAFQTSIGFPMSQFLNEKRTTLGRNARMLATQSFERVCNERSTINISLFYRALLEVLICENASELKQQVQVGKIRKFQNFNEYIELCSKKISSIDPKLHWTCDTVDRVQKKFSKDEHYMHLFYLLRMAFAQVLEGLIMLDRLLFLRELGYGKSYLVSIFDAVISPRHFGIIAMKSADSGPT